MSTKKKADNNANWVYFERVAVNLNALKPDRPRLDPDVKKAWIDALWFGFYKQGRNKLCDVDYGNNTSFCCLGVKHRIEGDTNERLFGRLIYFGRDKFVLGSEGNFYESINMRDSVMFEGKDYDKLANLNDNGATFREIAFVIDHVF